MSISTPNTNSEPFGPLVSTVPAALNDKAKRENISYSSNLTASTAPRYFWSDTQKTNQSITKLISKNGTDNNLELNNLAKDLADEIQDHVEMRIQLFVVLFLACHNKSFTFETNRAIAQAGIKNKESCRKGKKEAEIKQYQSDIREAHASTLPCLLYTEKKDTVLKDKRVFAYGSSLFNNQNLTHALPNFVNKIDSALDYQAKVDGSFFRDTTLSLLNKASKEKMDVNSGLLKFLTTLLQFTKEVKKRSTTVKKLNKDGVFLKYIDSHMATVLGYYKKVTKVYLDKLTSPTQKNTPSLLQLLTYTVKDGFDTKLLSQRIDSNMRLEMGLSEKFHEIFSCCSDTLGNAQHKFEITRAVIVTSCGDKNLEPFLLQKLTQNTPKLTDKVKQEKLHEIYKFVITFLAESPADIEAFKKNKKAFSTHVLNCKKNKEIIELVRNFYETLLLPSHSFIFHTNLPG